MDQPLGPAPRKLLIVEDDFYIRDVYKIEAQAQGYVVYEAADGAEALQLIKIAQPDLILLDIMLPKVSGLDVLKTVKSWDGFKNIPVIMVSNVGDSQIYQHAMQAGAVEYIVKFDSTPQKIIAGLKKYENPIPPITPAV